MSLYLKYLKVHFKSCMQYKLSFILSFIAQVFVMFNSYFTILCLFNRFSNINGFTMYEVLLTFGIIEFGYDFCDSFFRGIDQFDRLIVKGNLDRLLLRPKNILLQVCGEEINFIKISKLLQAIVIIIIALLKLQINWSISKIICLILILLSSIIIFLGLSILCAAYCFLTVKGLEVRNVFTCGCRDMARYPIGIFKKYVIIVLTYILPFSFVNYYPVLYLIGKTNNYFYSITPLITLLYLIPCVIIFYKGINKYTSTGS